MIMINMKEILKMENQMEKENIILMMGINIKGILKIENQMEKEYLF